MALPFREDVGTGGVAATIVWRFVLTNQGAVVEGIGLVTRGWVAHRVDESNPHWRLVVP